VGFFFHKKYVMAEEQELKPGQINIELTEEVAEGTYANLAIITHSTSEFVLDFIRVMPGTPKAKVKSRVLLTPQHAKRLYKALGENLDKFQKLNGEIKDLDQAQQPIPMNFGGTQGQA
jgi:hypothetical protein